MEQAQRQLRAAHLKPTPGRIAAWQTLHLAHEPVSFNDIQRMVFAEHPGIPFNTLYLALRQMEEKGLVRRLRVEGRNHAHFTLSDRKQFSQSLVCIQCGAQQWVDDASIKVAIADLCQRFGLEEKQYHLSIQTRCAHCDRAKAGRHKPRF